MFNPETCSWESILDPEFNKNIKVVFVGQYGDNIDVFKSISTWQQTSVQLEKMFLEYYTETLFI